MTLVNRIINRNTNRSTYDNLYHTINRFIYGNLYHIIDQKWSIKTMKHLGQDTQEEVKTMIKEYENREYDIVYGRDNENVLPDKLIIDEEHELNIRGSQSGDDFKVLITRLGSELHRHGLSHPVTTAESSKNSGRYIVIDGHMRTYTGRALTNNEIDGCHLPSNWRIQILKGKYYEEIPALEKLALRLSNTDLAQPFTNMSAGKGILQMLDIISKTLYKEPWDVIRAEGSRRNIIMEQLRKYNPHLTNGKIQACLKAAGGLSRMDDTQRKTVIQAIGAGTLSEQTLNYILDIPEDSSGQASIVSPVINEAIELYRTAAKQKKVRGLNSAISKAARMTQFAVKKQRVNVTPTAVLEEFKKNVTLANEVHTYSINNMPRTLSNALKTRAKEKNTIPSELCIDILQAFVVKEVP